jgi:hypothetical protein
LGFGLAMKLAKLQKRQIYVSRIQNLHRSW